MAGQTESRVPLIARVQFVQFLAMGGAIAAATTGAFGASERLQVAASLIGFALAWVVRSHRS